MNNYITAIKTARGELLNIELGFTKHELPRNHVTEARFRLGIVLEIFGGPGNPYTKSHSNRILFGNNEIVPVADQPLNITEWPEDEEDRLEALRKSLVVIQKFIQTRILIPGGRYGIGDAYEFASGAWVSVALARCWTTKILTDMAVPDEYQ